MSTRPSRMGGWCVLAVATMFAPGCASKPPASPAAGTGTDTSTDTRTDTDTGTGTGTGTDTSTATGTATATGTGTGTGTGTATSKGSGRKGPFPDDPPRHEVAASRAGADDEKAMTKQCKPMMDALNSRAQKGDKGKAIEIVADLRKKPPAGMPAAKAAECADTLERSVREYLAASIEVEARMMLSRLAKQMVNAFERDKKLCPSSDRPVPARFADVEAGPYEAKLADWNAPTWKCLGMELEGRQRYQYAVVSDDAAGTFEIIARGAPYQDGKAVDLVQTGKIIPGKGVEVPPAARR